MAGALLLPKEHGAYGQLAFPLLTALAVAGVSPGGLLLAAAAVAGFLAHEPAAVLLGLRGARAQRQIGRAARWWLGCWLAVGAAAAVGALLAIAPAARWSLAVPAVPAVVLGIATVRGREKSWVGETAAALAFSGAAVPIALAAGTPLATAATIAIPFALLFVASTLAVRVVILRVRGGGDPRAAAATRRAAWSVAAGATVALALSASTGVLPGAALWSALPGLVTAAVVAARPPAPTRLRTLGWTLVAVSVATAVLVVATARSRTPENNNRQLQPAAVAPAAVPRRRPRTQAGVAEARHGKIGCTAWHAWHASG